VGIATFGLGVQRASLWRGTSDSWEDLSLALGPKWDDARAYGIWNDARTLFVVGGGFNKETGRTEALMWTRAIEPCPADVNSSGIVDVDDLVAVILAWGPCPTPPASCDADTNASGAVDADDLLSVILAWGACL
jgi:hypothetical protein